MCLYERLAALADELKAEGSMARVNELNDICDKIQSLEDKLDLSEKLIRHYPLADFTLERTYINDVRKELFNYVQLSNF